MTPHQAYYKCIPNKQRDKDLEPYIIKSPQYAYYYAQELIKGRWTEAEHIISTNSEYAYFYARDVIKGKLPESMHNAMLIHADLYAKAYFNYIKNKTQP